MGVSSIFSLEVFFRAIRDFETARVLGYFELLEGFGPFFIFL